MKCRGGLAFSSATKAGSASSSELHGIPESNAMSHNLPVIACCQLSPSFAMPTPFGPSCACSDNPSSWSYDQLDNLQRPDLVLIRPEDISSDKCSSCPCPSLSPDTFAASSLLSRCWHTSCHSLCSSECLFSDNLYSLIQAFSSSEAPH